MDPDAPRCPKCSKPIDLTKERVMAREGPEGELELVHEWCSPEPPVPTWVQVG